MARGREWRDRSRRNSGDAPPELQQVPDGQHGGHRQETPLQEWRPRASLPPESQQPPDGHHAGSRRRRHRQDTRRLALGVLGPRASSSSPAPPASLPTDLQPSSSQARPAMQPALQASSSSPARHAFQQAFQPSSSSPAFPASLPTEFQPSSSSQPRPAMQPALQPSSSSPACPASWPQQRPLSPLNPHASCYNARPQAPPSSLPEPMWVPVFLPHSPLKHWPQSLDPLYLQQWYYQLHQKNPQQLYYLQPFLPSSGLGRPLVMIDPSARPHIPLFVQAQAQLQLQSAPTIIAPSARPHIPLFVQAQHWPPQTQFQLPPAPAIRAPPNYNPQDEIQQQQTMRNAALERYWAAYMRQIAAANRVENSIQELNTGGTEEPPDTDATPIKNGSESATPQQEEE